MPGVGSLHVGRKIGWVQVSMAGLGFILTNYFGVWLAFHLIKTKGSTILVLMDTHRLPQEFYQPLIVGVIGVCLFGSAFVWALITSLTVRSEVNHHMP